MRWLVGVSRAVRQAQRSSGLAAQHRSFAEKALQEMSWDDAIDGLASQVHSDEAKRELAALKSTFYEIKAKYEQLAKEPPPIDWEAYKQKVDPQLVAIFKEAYDTTPIPEYPGTEVEDAKAAFDELRKEADIMVEKSKKRVEEIKAEMKQIQAELDQMASLTIDEALAENPKVAAEIDQEISEGKWF